MDKHYDTLTYDTLEHLYLEQVTNGFESSNVSYMDVSYAVRSYLDVARSEDRARHFLSIVARRTPPNSIFMSQIWVAKRENLHN